MMEPPDRITPLPPEPRGPRLTPTERRLLYFLRGRPGQVIRRSELVCHVLADELAFRRTVDVHIHTLRRKLGPAARIRTIRGGGYAWASEPPHTSPLARSPSRRQATRTDDR